MSEGFCILIQAVGWTIIVVSLAGILYELVKGVRR